MEEGTTSVMARGGIGPATPPRRGVHGAVARVVDKAPPETFFITSAIFHYLGPAFAVLLFSRIAPVGVAWLRIATAAAVFAVWRRPWRSVAEIDRTGRRLLIGWGLTLAAMNSVFYLAIDRLPLSTVAAIEFAPVIAVAAIGTRSARNLVALVSAVAGVYLLTDVRLAGEPIGFVFAFANAGLFTCYIVLGHRIAGRGAAAGIDGLAAAMVIALAAATPFIGWAAPAFRDPAALLAGIGVGVSSSVIPYVTDQLAMARVARATYALLVSLLPATATIVGIMVLGQVPTWVEVVGVSLVIGGVALRRERGFDGRPADAERS